MRKIKNTKGITLIALVITVIVLLILAGVALTLILGQEGILTKTDESVSQYNKEEAQEAMNLKITSIQMKSYTEKQQLSTLQYLADKLCEDDEIEYVIKKSKEVASLDKIDVSDVTSIFTKIKKYPYEFEINSNLQLASIDGVKIAYGPSGEGISEETFNAMFYPNKQMQLNLNEHRVTIPRNGWLFIEFVKNPQGNNYWAERNGLRIMRVACPTVNTADSLYCPVKQGDIITVNGDTGLDSENYFHFNLYYYEKEEE